MRGNLGILLLPVILVIVVVIGCVLLIIKAVKAKSKTKNAINLFDDEKAEGKSVEKE